MPRPKNTFPTYCKHPQQHSARCWVGGRWVSLGRYDSPESRAEFARICAELGAGAPPTPKGGVTVMQLIARFRAHAEQFYRRPDGTHTSEVDEYKQALRVVREIYGHTPARDFGPVALQAVRAAMVKKGWCRSRVNLQVGRIRRCWKWAAANELVPGSLVADLAAVAGLRRGRSAAREMPPVLPAPEADYLAALPAMAPTLAAMVRLQRLSGLRPGEVRALTPADLVTTGEVWVYAPARHKMEHLGRVKCIPLSPAARAVIEPYLAGKGPGDLLFTPRAAKAELNAARRAARKSKVPPSQVSRAKPQTGPAVAFTRVGYAAWVRRACKRAGVKPWKPGQLRHSFATEVRERFGLEVSQVLLGHKKADVTQIYAEKNLAAGIAAAKALG